MSGTRTFISFEPVIAPNCPGVPPPTVIQYVRRAAREACQRTLAYRYTMDPVPLTPGTYEYDYDIPTGTEVCGLIHAALDGLKIEPATQEEIHSLYPAWPSEDSTTRSQPLFISQFDPDHFILAPVPDAKTTTTNYPLKLFLALQPNTTATSMDASVADELEEVIKHLTLKELFLIPDKSWSDDKTAGFHAREAAFRINMRRAKANLGVARASLTVRMRPFV